MQAEHMAARSPCGRKTGVPSDVSKFRINCGENKVRCNSNQAIGSVVLVR